MPSHGRPGRQGCKFYLAEEVSLLLPRGKVGQVAADHQVRVVQDRVEPAPGGQQGLDAQGDTVIASEPRQNCSAKVQAVPNFFFTFRRRIILAILVIITTDYIK